MEWTRGESPSTRRVDQPEGAHGHVCEGSGTAAPRTPHTWQLPLRLSVQRHDRHRPLLIVALAGLGIGVLLAVFGLPPVNFGDPLQMLGIVCPFCGGTRALQHVFLGEVGLAWRYNPLSVLLAAGAVGTLVRYAGGILSGRWLTVHVRWNAVTGAVLVATVGGLWINQLLHANLLLG